MPRLPIFSLLLLLLLAPGAAWSQASDWQDAEQARVRLISGVAGVGNDTEISAGLEVELKPGWHTYWRSPGDAGAPPDLQWNNATMQSVNLDHAELLYPVPDRHIQAGLETIGYEGHLVFPLLLTPKVPGQPVELMPKLTLLVCKDICVPNEFKLHLQIPVGAAVPSSFADLLKDWRARVPVRDLQALQITHTHPGDKGSLLVDFTVTQPLDNPRAFAETQDGGIFNPPDIKLDDDHKQGTITLNLRPGADLPHPAKLTLTLVDGERGWEQTTELADAPLAEPLTKPPVLAAPLPSMPMPPAPLLTMLLFAFLGGLILNLMPCVLPVLSLKVLKFMGHGGRENHEARHSFLATSAGILTSFMLLAGILLTLRAAGQSVGWGIQFQHQGFLLFLIAVLLVFSGNLWGFFEIQLPAKLNDKLFSASAHHPKLLGDFLTGAFAALLATPCTAPFLGTAIGFALSAGAGEIIGIFAGMGLGMATPYLLVATFPGLATRMPRPGKWMITLKRILALALLGTALWLGWILMMQNQAGEQIGEAAIHFDEAAIPQQVADGKTVFVDVTAAWCITCQVNKKLVLDRPEITARLTAPDVVFLKRDWTKPDAAIADYLHRFGRGGIPFNVIYGPGAPQGIVLPELLTVDIVTEALDKAAKKP